MIKILFVINKFTLGGAETVVMNQINQIDKNRFLPHLGILYRTTKSQNLYDRLTITSDRVTHFDFKNLKDVVAFVRLCVFLKKGKFDIVVSNLFESNFVCRLAAIIVRVPIILAVEHSSYFNKKWWQRVADRILARYSSAIITPSLDIADFTSRQEKISLSKFKVVGQITDLTLKGVFGRDEIREKFEIPKDGFVAVTVGRFSEEKAQEKVIEIAEEIVHVRKLNNYYFLIVGYGPRELELRTMIEKSRLERWVKIINDPANAKEYNIAGDVFLLPSKREGVPVALLEAMNMGLVPIATNVGGVKKVIQGSGFVCEQNDVLSMVESLILLNNDRALLSKKSALSKSMAEESRGRIEDLEKLLVNLYSKISK
ncbi:MAG: hypothetical protein A3H57_00020 [Candidatus Taylorbacteria bacterium RIFCSPLOWO2_02_FULL_43_11]|uniref:Glycosyl transferase family 1 domain-containing protein n=1 Tax=Candidatus Taylorbacteria bacterium RIFCSPHIGHO2_02_FULL_43_32b TaxID=1802306 RepID=A0A1G2MMF3_9BACT|nr:MAG: hypothetical protein A2743_02280 [Candidatus Taylorbacteria bacterium RIFCSPHIGHO2_01_FULL_43_47]OHA24182.1 MAG: hypothetical protein A3C72_03545 [Candidatus Taylorbacteria bacterium RIFCSPHIGHO2_02_FULL_43_32b]OHA31230.1 MAG: hypothetical protein A3B08_00650 [Candidatus Taylorbacteria bacterium RIFCSPLOWO2_01_FULL_43_44]OHA37637.1 MAG: hypothetical protein A3H57_00020 [Candidatus Taylorbacteria bacterium RIFCSPLOWO2_02_FULL_43_11]